MCTLPECETGIRIVSHIPPLGKPGMPHPFSFRSRSLFRAEIHFRASTTSRAIFESYVGFIARIFQGWDDRKERLPVLCGILNADEKHRFHTVHLVPVCAIVKRVFATR